MKASDLKNLIIDSLDGEYASDEILRELEKKGVSYSFQPGFREKVIDRIFTESLMVSREAEFVMSLKSVFYRIALTGVAAICLLLITIFLTEGSLSLNSFIGLNDSWDESIICILTGN
jgi:hypothetical protein